MLQTANDESTTIAEPKVKEVFEGGDRGPEWEGSDGEESEGGGSGSDDEAKDGSEVSEEQNMNIST